MRASIVRSKKTSTVEFSTLEDGDWFLDEDGDLCVKVEDLEGNNAVFFGTGVQKDVAAMHFDDSVEVTPVQVTISY